jgi:predicted Zn-dependent peptidase
MCSETFSPSKLLALKRQFIGHITLNNESLPSQMISYAKDYLDFNRLYLLDDVIAEIQALTPEMLAQTANEIMHPDRLSSLLFEPEED